MNIFVKLYINIKNYIDNKKIIVYKFVRCRHSSVGRATDL